MNEKKFLLLAGNKELNNSLKRYLKYVMNVFLVRDGLFSENEFSQKMMNYGFYIIQAFDMEEQKNPVGWRTAKKIVSPERRVLVLFLFVSESFPKEGPFWITFLSDKPLSEKIREVLDNPPPTEEDFERVEEMWPQLKYKPKGHHH
jgi:hypothetical protein